MVALLDDSVQDEISWLCATHKQRPYGWRSPAIHRSGGGMMIDYPEWARITDIELGIAEPEKIRMDFAEEPHVRNVHTEDSKKFLKDHPVSLYGEELDD